MKGGEKMVDELHENGLRGEIYEMSEKIEAAKEILEKIQRAAVVGVALNPDNEQLQEILSLILGKVEI